jgi:hypothetical protein
MSRAFKTSQKLQSHVHETSYSYWGEFDAEPLVGWLNSESRPTTDPVEKLLMLNRQLPIETTEQEVSACLGGIVRRYKLAVAPVLQGAAPDRWRIDWRLVGSMHPSQGLALVKLLHLADRGLIGRVRKCARNQCGKWFFARFQHQRFHSERCQQETFKSDPEWKMQRAKYMKDHRHRETLRNAASRVNRPKLKIKTRRKS